MKIFIILWEPFENKTASFLAVHEVLGVVACTYNPVRLAAEFRNAVDSIPINGNSPSLGGWIVCLPVIQHKASNLTK